MDTANLQILVEQLEENFDDLEDTVEPLLSYFLSLATQKLSPLDRAKSFVLIVYAIESLIFSYLRLNGVNAKEHAIFKELTRVKQYFEKIKNMEDGPQKSQQGLSLDKQATARFIKHGLSANHKLDLERVEREAKEKLVAKRKLQSLNNQKSTPSQPESSLSPTVHLKTEPNTQLSQEAADEGARNDLVDTSSLNRSSVSPSPAAASPIDDKQQGEADAAPKSTKTVRRARQRRRRKERKRHQSAQEVKGAG